jgi:prolipoprotein diacylglyceryltransferase
VHFPVYLHLGPFALHPHVVFETLAYFVGFRVYLWQRRRGGDVIDGHHRWSVIAAAIAGGAIGSKLLYLLENPALTLQRLTDLPYVMGGKTVVGGLLGGLVAVELTKRVLGVRRRTGDLFAVPLAIGIAVGRIGCFLTGLDDKTYGVATVLPWAVDFGDGVARHPTQIYEALCLAAIAGWLVWRGRRPHEEGALFRWMLTAYLALRLVVDAVKPDVRVALGLSSIQWACVAGLTYYAWHASRRASAPPLPT